MSRKAMPHLVTTTILGGAAGAALSFITVVGPTPSLRPIMAVNRPSEAQGALGVEPCGQHPAILGYVAQIAAGHAPAELGTAGYRVSSLVDVGGLSGRPTVLIAPMPSTSVGVAIAKPPLPSSPAVAGVGVVYAQASAPNLLSCDYQLADRPDAQRYLLAARSFLTTAGIVGTAQLNASPSYTLSDDPLDSTALIVTMDVEGPRQTGAGLPSDVALYSTTAFVAVVARSTATVLASGLWP